MSLEHIEQRCNSAPLCSLEQLRAHPTGDRSAADLAVCDRKALKAFFENGSNVRFYRLDHHIFRLFLALLYVNEPRQCIGLTEFSRLTVLDMEIIAE